MAYSVIKKELSAYTYRKYPRTCSNNKTESTKFFIFAVVFLQPLFSLSLSLFLFQFVFFLSSPFPHLSSYYILWLFLPFPPSKCGSGGGSPFSLLLPPFLESSILSCKAASSLFRHHLHINAARGLVGQHLMRRQQYPQIFVFSHFYPLYDISSFTLLQGLSEMLP